MSLDLERARDKDWPLASADLGGLRDEERVRLVLSEEADRPFLEADLPRAFFLSGDLDGEGGEASVGLGFRMMLGGFLVDVVRGLRASVEIVSHLLLAFLLAELVTGILHS